MRVRWIALRLLGAVALGLTTVSGACAEVTLQVDALDSQQTNTVDFGNAQSLTATGENPLNKLTQRVRLNISSSSTGRYRVVQQVNSRWANPEGGDLPLEGVLFAVTETTPRGDVRVPSPTPMRWGEQEIYLSPESGGNAELIITYSVQVPEGQRAGRYLMPVVYRVVSQ